MAAQAKSTTSPTLEVYDELQTAYEHFNRELFDGSLPNCLITLQRAKASLGFFSAQRFTNLFGELTDEIAMNPAYFAIRGIKDTLSTLTHEMVHLWQAHYGKPARGRYHNREWAAKMIAIGLMPSYDEKPGGKKVGEHISHYTVTGGRFERAFNRLVTETYRISCYDRFLPRMASRFGLSSTAPVPGLTASSTIAPAPGALSSMQLITPEPKVSTRVKYSCLECGINVWGRPNLRISCDDCGAVPEPVG